MVPSVVRAIVSAFVCFSLEQGPKVNFKEQYFQGVLTDTEKGQIYGKLH